MPQPDQKQRGTGGASNPERRKHWRDRRMLADRRNPERQQHADFECRYGVPRRRSDVGGELAEGEIWWQPEGKKSR